MDWTPGTTVAAIQEGDRLRLHVRAPAPLRLQFDFLDRNDVRLNERPEWFVVDENRLYRVARPDGGPSRRLGAEPVTGIELNVGD